MSGKNGFYATRPDVFLRTEALAELIAVCVAYNHFFAGRWGLFALLFLAPDISLLGYALPSKRFAADFYNVIHTYVGPLTLGLFAYVLHWSLTGQLCLIWMAHIGFDRAMGYGLKSRASFKATHIQMSALQEPSC
jgi:hypothetical protein